MRCKNSIMLPENMENSWTCERLCNVNLIPPPGFNPKIYIHITMKTLGTWAVTIFQWDCILKAIETSSDSQNNSLRNCFLDIFLVKFLCIQH